METKSFSCVAKRDYFAAIYNTLVRRNSVTSLELTLKKPSEMGGRCQALFGVLILYVLVLMPSIVGAQNALPYQWLYSPITQVNCIAYSPDGSTIAVGGSGGIQLFSVTSGSLKCLPEIGTNVTAVAFAPDGKTLAANGLGSSGSVVKLWSLANRSVTGTLNTAATNSISSLVYSTDGKFIVVGGRSYSNPTGNSFAVIELWSTTTGSLVNSLNTGITGSVDAVALSPDGKFLADRGFRTSNSVSTDLLELWDISNNSLTATLKTAAINGSTIAFSRDSTLLAVGGSGQFGGGQLELWNVSTASLKSTLTTTADYSVNSLLFSPDKTTLIAGGQHWSDATSNTIGVLEMWNVTSGSFISSLPTPVTRNVKTIAISPDGKTLVDGGVVSNGDYSFAFPGIDEWSLPQGILIKSLSCCYEVGVSSISFSPDGTTLALTGTSSDGYSGALESWVVGTGQPNQPMSVGGSGLLSATYSPDGGTLGVGGFGGILETWDVVSGMSKSTIQTSANPVYAVAFSPDGKVLADGGFGGDGVLELWDIAKGTLIQSLDPAAVEGVMAIAFSPDGKTLAVGGGGAFNGTGSGVLELWDLPKGKLLAALDTYCNPVDSVAFSPDGSVFVASGSRDAVGAVAEVWSVTSGGKLATLPIFSQPNYARSIAITPDGKFVFIGTDYNIQAFSMGTYARLAYYPTTDPVTSLALTADGSLLTYGTKSGEIFLSPNPFGNTVPVSAFSVNPSSVVGGANVIGTVTLSQPAPAGGDIVTLQSGNPNVAVPFFVVVPSGATQATFAISTFAVASSQTATLTATSGGASASASLSLVGFSISSLTLSPATVRGGTMSTATVILSYPAPTGGIVLDLSSSSSNAVVSKSITVGSGATQATFSVNTVGVDGQSTATITVGSGSTTKSVVLTIVPAVLYSVTMNPSSIGGGNSATGTVTLTGPAGPSGTVVGLASDNSAAYVSPSVTVPAGYVSATFTVNTSGVNVPTNVKITATLSGSSQFATLAINPAAVSAFGLNPSVVRGGDASTGSVSLSGNAGSGGLLVTLTSNNAAATIPKSVTVPSGQSVASFRISTVPVSVQKVVTFTAKNGAVSKTANLTVNPAELSSVSLNPSTVAGGGTSTGTVTLTSPAGSGMVVKLSSSSPLAKVPGTVSISAGKTSGAFSVKTVSVPAQAAAVLTANLNGTMQSATLTITPPVIVSVTLNPTSVKGGKSSSGTVTLSSPAPTGGLIVSLISNSAKATVAASLTVAVGKTTGTFTVKTSAVSSTTTVKITATLGSASKTAGLTIS